MGKKHPLRIETVIMKGDGDTLYFSRGHHDFAEFAEAVVEDIDEGFGDVPPGDIEHQHWRSMPDRCWWRSRSAGHGISA